MRTRIAAGVVVALLSFLAGWFANSAGQTVEALQTDVSSLRTDDVRDRLAVHPGRAAVATHRLPGDREHVVAPHLVAQRVEPEARSFLRFRM